MAGVESASRQLVAAALVGAIVLIAVAPLVSNAPLAAAVIDASRSSGWCEIPAISPQLRVGLHVIVSILLFFALQSVVSDVGARMFASCFFALHPLRIEALLWPDGGAVALGLLWTLALWVGATHAISAARVRLVLSAAVVVAVSLVSGSGGLLAMVLAMQAAAARRPNAARFWVALSGVLLLASGQEAMRMMNPESLARFVVSLVTDLRFTIAPIGWAPLGAASELMWWAPLGAVGIVLTGAALIQARHTHAALFVGTCGYMVASLGAWESGWSARDAYVPHIVLAFAAAWALGRVATGCGTTRRGFLSGAVVLLLFVGMRCELGTWADSRDVLTRAVRVHPDSPAAHHALARMLAVHGEWQGAIAVFREALRLDPQDARSHMHLGALYASHGFARHADYHLRAAVRFAPTQGAPHARLGQFLLDHGQHEAALPVLRRAVEIDPSDAAARMCLAQVLHRSGQRTEALEHAYAVLRMAPDTRRAHAMVAEELAGSGRLEEARERWRTVLDLASDDADAWTRLGNVEARLGNIGAAGEAYRSALAVDPTHADARRHLDLVLSLAAEP